MNCVAAMQQTELDRQCFDAVSAGDVELVGKCLSDGADANVADDSSGYLPIAMAAHMGFESVAELLLQKGAVMDHGAQLEAVNMGHVAVLCVLLEHGADPNWSHPETGETPLHVATYRAHRAGTEQCVRRLLDAGANVNVRTKNRVGSATFDGGYVVGETPLHNAAAYGSLAMIRMLIEAGADELAEDADGHTPREYCARHQRSNPHQTLERSEFIQVLEMLPFREPECSSGNEAEAPDA